MKAHNKNQNRPNFKIDEITLVLIVAVIAIIVSVYDKNSQPNQQIEAEKITGLILDNHEVSFASNGIVDPSKLKEIQNMDYNKLKIYFNARKDFCMYIEDGDGNIILAKGSSKLSKDGINCKE